MKKFLSVIIVAILLFTMIPSTVFAASAPKILASADTTSIKAGDVVTVTVKLPANSNLVAFTYSLKYDTSYFQLVSGSAKVFGAFPSEATNANLAGEFRYIGATGTSVTAAGNLFTAQFKVVKTGGKITCEVKEAYVLSNGKDVDVTSACASTSTKSISFSAAPSAPIDFFEIAKPSTTEILYKNGIVLHVNEKITKPLGATYQWSVNNNCFKIEASEDGKSCTIVSNSNGEAVITVKLVSALGVTLDTETIVMKSKAGFFDKIVAFFRSIFGGYKIAPN